MTEAPIQSGRNYRRRQRIPYDIMVWHKTVYLPAGRAYPNVASDLATLAQAACLAWEEDALHHLVSRTLM